MEYWDYQQRKVWASTAFALALTIEQRSVPEGMETQCGVPIEADLLRSVSRVIIRSGGEEIIGLQTLWSAPRWFRVAIAAMLMNDYNTSIAVLTKELQKANGNGQPPPSGGSGGSLMETHSQIEDQDEIEVDGSGIPVRSAA